MSPSSPNEYLNLNNTSIYQNTDRPPGKSLKSKLFIILLVLFSAIILFVILGISFAVIGGFIGFGINNKPTIDKVKIIKIQMDKICNDFGYFDKEKVFKIDRSYPNEAWNKDSRDNIDLGCLEQDNASGKWPDKCNGAYIEYVLGGSKSPDAPGDSSRSENEYGGEWYTYTYRFYCPNDK